MSGTEYMTNRDVTKIVPDATGLTACFGCTKCTSGCPVARQMDVKPHQAMRMLQLGLVEDLLAAAGPWRCVGCGCERVGDS